VTAVPRQEATKNIENQAITTSNDGVSFRFKSDAFLEWEIQSIVRSCEGAAQASLKEQRCNIVDVKPLQASFHSSKGFHLRGQQ
jgi:hypothetical protein